MITTEGALRRTFVRSATALAVVTLGARASAAPELVYYQDWEEADALAATSWVTTPHCYYEPAELEAPQSKSPLATVECTGKHETETKLGYAGRTFSKKAIQVAAADRLCVTAWIRTNGAAGSRAQPFVGVNFTDSATGFGAAGRSAGGCYNRERWLLGDGNAYDPEVGAFTDGENYWGTTCTHDTGDNCCNSRSTSPYGPTTAVGSENDTSWHFYSKTFTVHSSDVSNANTWMILKLQNGAGNDCGDVAPAAADFDDLRVYKLPNVADVCPTQANAIAAGDDAHTTCAGDKAFCVSKNVNTTVAGAARTINQWYCDGCATSYGSGENAACPTTAAPACDSQTHTCEKCNGDHDSGATRPCSAAHPVCSPTGTCGSCATSEECNAAPGITHRGPNCVAGKCSGICMLAADGTSAQCSTNSYCIAGEGAGTGCKAKRPNGEPIPSRNEDGDVAGKCVLAGARVTATIFCASGTCSATDNLCGLPNGDACTATGQCRSTCHIDGKCGLPQGTACTASTECRGDLTCEGGLCGGKVVACTTDADCGTTNFVCGPAGACAPGCRGTGGNGCSGQRVCSSVDGAIGQCVDPTADAGTGGARPVDTGDAGAVVPPPAADAGCSTSNANGGSLAPLVLGLGVVLGALRRRRSNDSRPRSN